MQAQFIQGAQSEVQAVATHCPYCAFQCGVYLTERAESMEIAPNQDFPVNRGGLCIKGWTSADLLRHPERLLRPLVRNARGVLAPSTWEAALKQTAEAMQQAARKHGKEAVGVFGGGSLTNEKAYLLGKFARVALGTSNIDYNGRFCMSSAAAAGIKAFGMDRGLPFPVEDIAGAGVILLAGSNVAETMPPIMQYFEKQRANGGKLIVVDPRLTPTARAAALHLRLVPGTDAALANGLLHLLIRTGSIDQEYIRRRTENFEQVKAVVASYWPDRVERITGVSEPHLILAAELLGRADTAMVLTARGPEQQSQGVRNTLCYINLALALGKVGKPFSGYGTLTGQGNGQGGREHGQKADQLPGYRKIIDPAARQHMSRVWGIPEPEIPGPGKSAYEMLDSLGEKDGVHALLVVGSNIAVSAPDSLNIQKRLRSSLDFLAVADFFLSETAQLADVVFPSAQFAEEEGTMTNLEGRVIRRKAVATPPGDVRTDIALLCALAGYLGKRKFFPYANTREVFEELRLASAGGIADYSGITYEKIDAAHGIFWPCPADDHPGTPRLFQETFPTSSGKASFHAVRHQSPAEEPDAQYPFYLTTGRVLAQYQSGAQTRRVDELNRLAPEPVAELHPDVARAHRLAEGAMVDLVTRRGVARFKVKITPGIQHDTVFVPFHWGETQGINQLTNPALDPISLMPEFKVCAVRIENAGAERPLE